MRVGVLGCGRFGFGENTASTQRFFEQDASHLTREPLLTFREPVNQLSQVLFARNGDV